MTTSDAPDDSDTVARLLGRRPLAAFDVVVRRADSTPVVIRNAPLLPDGTPMPTRYWLVDPELNREIGRLEAAGGVDRAEAEVDPRHLQRPTPATPLSATLRSQPNTTVRLYGGVGGTRIGVKCLHTHYAHFLATGDDPVGSWTAQHLPERVLKIAVAHDGTDDHDGTDQEEPAGG